MFSDGYDALAAGLGAARPGIIGVGPATGRKAGFVDVDERFDVLAADRPGSCTPLPVAVVVDVAPGKGRPFGVCDAEAASRAVRSLATLAALAAANIFCKSVMGGMPETAGGLGAPPGADTLEFDEPAPEVLVLLAFGPSLEAARGTFFLKLGIDDLLEPSPFADALACLPFSTWLSRYATALSMSTALESSGLSACALAYWPAALLWVHGKCVGGKRGEKSGMPTHCVVAPWPRPAWRV